MPRALIFSDIHNDARALEKLMDIEADYYFCAGDLVSWERGLDKMGELMKRRADACMCCREITNRSATSRNSASATDL